MPTLTTGNSTTFGVYGDQTITLNTTSGTEGTVTWNSPNGAQVVTVGPMPLVNKTISMNGVTSALTITCKTGALTYDVSGSNLGVAAANKTLLPKLQTALTATRAGSRNTRVLCLGDSTTAGQYASGSNYANCRPLNYPNALAALLAARGYATYTGNQFGSGENAGNKTNFLAFDPRWTLDANWAVNSGFPLVGGCALSSGTSGATLTFTPTASDKAWDTAEIYYISTSTTGTFSWQIGSGSVNNVNTANATSQMAKVTVTGSLALQTLTLKIVGSTNVFLLGVTTYNSAAKGIEVITAGGGGYPSATLAANTNAWDPAYVSTSLGSSKVIAPDLTIINIGINDWSTAVAPATFATNLATIIAAWKLAGDVILMTPTPQSTSVTSLATQLGIVQEVRKAAMNNGCLLLEGNALYGDWAFASGSLGYFAPANDASHPGQTGYAALAALVSTSLPI